MQIVRQRPAHFSSCLEGRGIFVSSLKKPQTLAGSRPAKGPSTAPMDVFGLLLGLSVCARFAKVGVYSLSRPVASLFVDMRVFKRETGCGSS